MSSLAYFTQEPSFWKSISRFSGIIMKAGADTTNSADFKGLVHHREFH